MSALQHVSLFSGIGGIDIAFERAGVPTIAACEIDDAARGVIADRTPHVHLFTDVKEVTGRDLEAIGCDPRRTVLSAGFPCQDLSVAGARRGLGEGTRSGLYWEVDRLLGEFRPAWVVLENVPGLLSTACACPGDGTCEERGLADQCPRDGSHAVSGGACWGDCIARHGGVMGAVLGSLAKRGYGFAYRVLDAQHFGVPQRRRRVVIVGRLGDDGSAPAQVLLEPEGMRGNPAEGITPRPLFARTAQGGNRASGILGERAHTLTGEGFDTSEDGTGRGTPVIAFHMTNDTAATLTAGVSRPGVNAPGRRQEDDVNLVAYVADTAATLLAGHGDQGHRIDAEGAAGGHLIAYVAEKTGSIDTRQGGTDVKEAQDGRLVATYQKVVRSGARDSDGGLPPEVWAEREVAATLSPFDLGSETRAVELVLAPTLTASLGQGGWAGHNRKDEMVEKTIEAGATVRRLTPTECSRLQGFPDDWNATSWGKSQSDSPRYKQLGNAVAVPVFEWVAKRIVAVDGEVGPTT